MKFHKEGIASLTTVILFVMVLNSLTYFLFKENELIIYSGYALSLFLIVAIVQFFRSPNRKITCNENAIISPADGKVVVIEEVEETEFLNEKRLQVSIFMSPTNVHLNRYPISGIIKYFKFHTGKYLVAWHPKSSIDNERTTIVVEHQNGKTVLFRQIAGAMARRIVFYGKEQQDVKQADECGFIKFGSRVDLLLPLDVQLQVKLYEKVKGGLSTIAHF